MGDLSKNVHLLGPLMCTLDIIYIHYGLPFAIRTVKAEAKEKRVSRYTTRDTNTKIPNRDLMRSILRRYSYANGKLNMKEHATLSLKNTQNSPKPHTIRYTIHEEFTRSKTDCVFLT